MDNKNISIDIYYGSTNLKNKFLQSCKEEYSSIKSKVSLAISENETREKKKRRVNFIIPFIILFLSIIVFIWSANNNNIAGQAITLILVIAVSCFYIKMLDFYTKRLEKIENKSPHKQDYDNEYSLTQYINKHYGDYLDVLFAIESNKILSVRFKNSTKKEGCYDILFEVEDENKFVNELSLTGIVALRTTKESCKNKVQLIVKNGVSIIYSYYEDLLLDIVHRNINIITEENK